MEKLYQVIYNDIVNKINSGEYSSGQRLPTEFELTGLYNVSRITATRAMKELEKNLFVIRKQKVGTFVRDFPVALPISNTEKLVPVILPFDKHLGINIIFGADSQAGKNHMFTSFFHTQNNFKNERTILQKILNMNLGGVILCPCSTYENIDVLSEFIARKIPLVYVDRPVLGVSAPCVTSDNERGMFGVVDRLIKMGHRKIAYYPYHCNMIETERLRFSGYCKAFTENNLMISNEFLTVNSPGYHIRLSLIAASRALGAVDHYINNAIDYYLTLPEMPTAVVCANDVTAYTFIKCLNHRGFKVPEDIVVTGYDNIPLNDKSVQLTTVEQDMYKMGSVAMDTILQLIRGETVIPCVSLPTKFVERSSTCYAKDQNRKKE